MTDKETKPAAKKNALLFPAIAAVGLLALGSAMFISKAPTETPAVSEEAPAEQTATTGEQPADATATAASTVTIDVNAALSDRILGNTSAPVRISEHASLTCSHCGAFHRETFDKLKADYIDTGKVYVVFSDFPLNEPAIDATMVSRCLPEDKYFDFIHMLFQKQEDWAYSKEYRTFLKDESAKVGLDEAHFDACLANQELKDGIANRMKGIQQQWNINSTPSFVINNKTTINGVLPYEDLKKAIEAAMGTEATEAPASETPQAAPVAEEETKAPEAATEEPAATEEKATKDSAPADAPAEAAKETEAAPSGIPGEVVDEAVKIIEKKAE